MPAKLTPFAHILAVADLEASAAHYRDALGFRVLWPDGSDWRLVVRDELRIMLGACPDEKPASDIGDHSLFAYAHVDDVDTLYAEFTSRGAKVTAPADRPHGLREIVVTTIDGHRLLFGQELRKPTP
jgi:predicted enzyme related to lactoylglutathione lyase